MTRQLVQWASASLSGQQGFALITAIMLLFVAMILGLMVVDSADMEVLLSGAQQRYEDSLNIAEGGAGVEAVAVGTGDPISRGGTTRAYVVVNPSVPNQVLSPIDPDTAIFDPGNDIPTVTSTVDTDTEPEAWSMDNLLQSDSDADDRLDYHYRTIYRHDDNPPKGYDATKFSGYLFEISAQRTTEVKMGGNKVGPKMSL